MQNFRKNIKSLIDSLKIVREKRNEIKKFKDPRRTRIFSAVDLSKVEQEQIDQYYLKYYGKKIPHTWHRHFTAFTGQFDYKYFPELLYIPEFERYMNYRQQFATAFADKNLIGYIADACGVKNATNIISCVDGLYRDQCNNHIEFDQVIKIMKDIGEVFVKPSIDSSSGEGCFCACINNGKDIYSSDSLEDILERCGANFCVQEVIKNSECIKKLHPNSINTFRIITYRWKGKICHMPVVMRIGVGNSNVDNAHAGGVFIAIDDDGTLHDTAFTEFNTQYKVHPDTEICFDGYQIYSFEKVINAAKKMHAAIPQLGVYNWDFTINDNEEPVLIEANTRGGSIWLSEMAHGVGCFGERTNEVLMWLRAVREASSSEKIDIIKSIL